MGIPGSDARVERKCCVSFPHCIGDFSVWGCCLLCWVGWRYSEILATTSDYRRLPASAGGLQSRHRVCWQTRIGELCQHLPHRDNTGLAWHLCLTFRSGFWCYSSRYPKVTRKLPGQIARSVAALTIGRLTKGPTGPQKAPGRQSRASSVAGPVNPNVAPMGGKHGKVYKRKLQKGFLRHSD